MRVSTTITPSTYILPSATTTTKLAPVVTTTLPAPTTTHTHAQRTTTSTNAKPVIVVPPVGDETNDYETWPDTPMWLAIGRCEQPGPGAHGVWWTHVSQKYGGGLGIYNPNWHAAARALGLPMNAWEASPADQIRGARYHRQHHGLNGWGCAIKLGYAN